jgi:hypothetical protein
MLYEETTDSLFPSDLFIQPGDQPPVVTENLSAEMVGFYRSAGIFAHEQPVRELLDRLDTLAPQWVHAMHGGTLTAEALPAYIGALRDHPFAYHGTLLGRQVIAA